MVVQETITIGSIKLRRTYSDNNRYIIQVDTGSEYREAVDPLDSAHTYAESDNELPSPILTPEEQLEALGVNPNYNE